LLVALGTVLAGLMSTMWWLRDESLATDPGQASAAGEFEGRAALAARDPMVAVGEGTRASASWSCMVSVRDPNGDPIHGAKISSASEAHDTGRDGSCRVLASSEILVSATGYLEQRLTLHAEQAEVAVVLLPEAELELVVEGESGPCVVCVRSDVDATFRRDVAIGGAQSDVAHRLRVPVGALSVYLESDSVFVRQVTFLDRSGRGAPLGDMNWFAVPEVATVKLSLAKPFVAWLRLESDEAIIHFFRVSHGAAFTSKGHFDRLERIRAKLEADCPGSVAVAWLPAMDPPPAIVWEGFARFSGWLRHEARVQNLEAAAPERISVPHSGEDRTAKVSMPEVPAMIPLRLGMADSEHRSWAFHLQPGKVITVPAGAYHVSLPDEFSRWSSEIEIPTKLVTLVPGQEIELRAASRSALAKVSYFVTAEDAKGVRRRKTSQVDMFDKGVGVGFLTCDASLDHSAWLPVGRPLEFRMRSLVGGAIRDLSATVQLTGLESQVEIALR
jgi:hypothetical protein